MAMRLFAVRASAIISISILVVASFACIQDSNGGTPPHKTQRLTRKHRCPEVPSLGRVIKEPDEVVPPRILKRPDLSKLNNEPIFKKICNHRLVYEVLINEVGRVECVETLDSGCNAGEVAEHFANAIKSGYEFMPPRDSTGRVVACYWISTINW
jgi:hypothetical protein